MRIIGGQYRGRKLTPPPDQNIRPTTDRMRETIFNILVHHRPLPGTRVLDVFAGTGALGLEALSRGAAHATFFDRDRKSLELVAKNIALLKAEDRTTIRCITAPKFPPSPQNYDVIFLDPPYNLDVIIESIQSLEDHNYLADGAIVIAEYDPHNQLTFPDYLDLITDRTYGDAHFSILRRKS